MRVQHHPEQPVLRHHVDFIHALALLPFPPCLLPALDVPSHRPPDLAQFVVVVDIPGQADEEDHHAEFDVYGAAGPVGGGEGAVRGEVAADGGGVDELEGEGGEPDGEVDGGHGGVEEGGEEGAVEVVDGL